MKKNNFATKESLEQFLESEESEDLKNQNFTSLMFDLDFGSTPTWEEAYYQGKWFPVPYWVEKYSSDEYLAEYQDGYYEPLAIGAIVKYEDNEYEYVDSQSLSEEIEHQAEDGELVYEYRGHSFFRIWKKI